ncbi:MAG: T9SS type A sorting domain-containing protein [Sphingobacteriaceae bacterium]|jgi:hypothetical protein
MKKLLALLFISIITNAQAQAPVIEGTYFPVRNTKIKQIWDTIQGVINVPTMGANQVWDYTQANGQFVNPCDTFDIKVFDPANAPKNQYFPGAAFAIFMRTPMPNDPFDSLYHFYSADHEIGLRKMGGFNISPMYDSTIIFSPQAFFSAPTMSFGTTITDTARGMIYINNFMGFKGKIKTKRFSTYTYVGYGTLKLPGHTYNNVAQVREVWNGLDSIYVDIMNNGNYTFYTTRVGMGKVYNFYRNNTFGTAYLMYLNVNPANTIVEQAFFTLPADIGSINGTVFTNASETTPVTNGEMYLYRENSNFAKNDILARTMLKPTGTFQFDSIPYGEYRIAVRPNLTAYPNSKITYYGDTTDWINASVITTTSSISTGHKIHLQYHPSPAGTSTVNGVLMLDYAYGRGLSPLASKPVPGIGVIIKKHPGNTSARVTVTDSNGLFDLGALDNGSYELFVDIPGMHMTGTYSFVVSNNNIVNGLDFKVGKDSIHPINSVIGIKEFSRTNDSKVSMSAFPNPYNSAVNIQVNLADDADVVLEIYNLLGDKIQTLENTRKQAGNHYYSFSAKGLNAAPGVYIVKLQAGKSLRVLKVIEH